MDSMASSEQARLRIRIACDECRKNKRKCQGQRPICALCEKGGKVCHYPSELSRKRKNYDDGYIRDLEDKVKALEAQLDRHRSSEPQSQHPMGHEILPVHEHEHDSAKYTLPPTDENEIITSDKEEDGNGPRSKAALEELASLMLTMGIEEKGEPSFTIASGKDKYSSRSEKNITRVMGFDSSHHETNYTDNGFHPETRRQLIDCFMTSFNIYHQFISQAELQCMLMETTAPTEPDLGFRNHALLSVGAFLSPNSDLKALSTHHAISAEKILLRCIREHPSDLAVQGLALLSWRELILENNSMAYTYIAMATGLILYLGLHVSDLGPGKASDLTLSRTPTIDYYTRRRRIRSFWAYFSVDRMVTSSLGMNCTIHWQRLRVTPFIDALDHDPLLDELAHDKFCQLWHLWDSFMDQRYAFGWTELKPQQRQNLLNSAHKALTNFYTSTDNKLALSKTYMPQSCFLFQLAYHTAILLIHRPFLNEPKGSETLSFALRSATNAAASIARIVRAYRKFRGFADANPQTIDCILSAAVIHLLNATSGRNSLGKQSANSLRGCLNALEEIQNTSLPQARRAIRQLQELANKWKVVWALPIHLSQHLPEDTSQNHNLSDIPPLEWTNGPSSISLISHDFNIGEMVNGQIYPGFNNEFGDSWDPSLFENALEHVNLPEHIAYQSSLQWLFDESIGDL